MATTGFWPIKGSLKDLIKYADNPDKTTNPKYLDDDLAKALEYVENGTQLEVSLDEEDYNVYKQYIVEE